MNWQPIETAPTNKSVLVCRGQFVFIAQKMDDKVLATWSYDPDWLDYDEDDDEFYFPSGWYQVTDCDSCDVMFTQLSDHEQPTHWKPLPTPHDKLRRRS